MTRQAAAELEIPFKCILRVFSIYVQNIVCFSPCQQDVDLSCVPLLFLSGCEDCASPHIIHCTGVKH